MRFDILTLFPEALTSYLTTSIIGRALAAEKITIAVHNIRDYALDKHHTTDDTPYGGGAGMVMKIEPIAGALTAVTKAVPRKQQHVVVLSAKGQPFTQQKGLAYAESSKSLTLICGRYEGIDQRVIDHLADEELSVGPYVLAGGELPALIVVETVARLIPGVLGNPDSLTEESHVTESVTEYPQYTKPEVYNGMSVPKILLSGNHAAISEWRRSQQKAGDHGRKI
ncbi:MAG: tRNA (guanosine(37)-N1)-methyltransferase TrmD [Candidatus Andersenbacteria bacterium]